MSMIVRIVEDHGFSKEQLEFFRKRLRFHAVGEDYEIDDLQELQVLMFESPQPIAMDHDDTVVFLKHPDKEN